MNDKDLFQLYALMNDKKQELIDYYRSGFINKLKTQIKTKFQFEADIDLIILKCLLGIEKILTDSIEENNNGKKENK